MINRQALSQHLSALQQARAEAYAAGDWDRVEILQLCIDDTRKALAAA